MLANELAVYLEAQERPVIRASIDDFHRPRSERYQRGQDSPEGYYKDTFDYPKFREALLVPLGPQGNRKFKRAVFDVQSDTTLQVKEEEAQVNAILLCDGVFLQRPELDPLWDYRIFVSVDFEVALQRARMRDQYLFGSLEEVQARYLQRYIPGQKIYLQSVHPHERANLILDNNDLAYPQLIFPS
jgi:uridine kinase